MREKLDQETRALLGVMDSLGAPPMETMSVEDARQALRALFESFGGRPEEVVRVDDIEIPGPGGAIPARLYYPAGDEPRPGFVHLHGGGWAVGDLDCYEADQRKIANSTGAVVVAVDYRLAPEHKFPAGFDDCYAAAVWVERNAARLGIDPRRIVIGGDSADANLSAAVALKARDQGAPALALQVLIYGTYDIQSTGTASYEEFAEGHFLTKSMAEWFQELYIRGPEDRGSPYASPLLATDLRGVAPALFLTAECDVLRDEGDAYARRLREAGTPVTAKRFSGTIHGFASLAKMLPVHAERAFSEIGAAVRTLGV